VLLEQLYSPLNFLMIAVLVSKFKLRFQPEHSAGAVQARQAGRKAAETLAWKNQLLRESDGRKTRRAGKARAGQT
jgi:hypothetical protein